VSEETFTLLQERIMEALALAFDYGQIDGAHHKTWVIDQMVRCLSADYDEWVANFSDGEDGANTYYWDEGIAP
jgi:hypothetical protein